jgi:hypothetical protein
LGFFLHKLLEDMVMHLIYVTIDYGIFTSKDK